MENHIQKNKIMINNKLYYLENHSSGKIFKTSNAYRYIHILLLKLNIQKSKHLQKYKERLVDNKNLPTVIEGGPPSNTAKPEITSLNENAETNNDIESKFYSISLFPPSA